MDFSKLSEHIITRRFEVIEGEGFSLTWDANKFNGELERRKGRTFKEQAVKMDGLQKEVFGQSQSKAEDAEQATEEKKPNSLLEIAEQFESRMELDATIDDINKVVWADALAVDGYGVLKDWEMEDKGAHVKPTFGRLMEVPGNLLQEIYAFCREESLPKKAETTPNSQTTSEITNSGLPEKPDTQTLESQSMSTATSSPAS